MKLVKKDVEYVANGSERITIESTSGFAKLNLKLLAKNKGKSREYVWTMISKNKKWYSL